MDKKKKFFLIGIIFTCFIAWLFNDFIVFQLSGYNLILYNKSTQNLEYIGLVTYSIMEDTNINFHDDPGGVDVIEGQFIGKNYSFTSAIMQADHIAPRERIFINRKGNLKCENLAVMVIDSSQKVTIIPVFYVMSKEFTHIAQITVLTEANNKLILNLNCYNSGKDIPIFLWWLKITLNQTLKSITI